MKWPGLLVTVLLLFSAGPAWAQADVDSAAPNADELPPQHALVRLDPAWDPSGDWIFGTLTFARTQQRRCPAIITHVPDASAYIVGNADSLELAWRDGAALFPHNRTQVDSMAAGATWHRVNLAKALEGVPECLPERP